LVELAYVNSKLPNTPDIKAINDFQVDMLSEFYGIKA